MKTLSLTIERPKTEVTSKRNSNTELPVSGYINNKGRLVLKRELVRQVFGINLPARLPMQVVERNYANGRLQSFMLVPTPLPQTEGIWLTRFKNSGLLILNLFLYLEDLNYREFEYEIGSSPTQLPDGTSAIVLRIVDIGSRRSRCNGLDVKSMQSADTFNVKLHTNTTDFAHQLMVTESSQFQTIMNTFFHWKASQYYQTDGFAFEREFDTFCQQFIQILFQLALPPSLPYKGMFFQQSRLTPSATK